MAADVILKDVNKVYPNGFHAVYDFNIEIEKAIARSMILKILDQNFISEAEADALIEKTYTALDAPLIENSA